MDDYEDETPATGMGLGGENGSHTLPRLVPGRRVHYEYGLLDDRSHRKPNLSPGQLHFLMVFGMALLVFGLLYLLIWAWDRSRELLTKRKSRRVLPCTMTEENANGEPPAKRAKTNGNEYISSMIDEDSVSPIESELTDEYWTVSEEDEEYHFYMNKEQLAELARLRAFPRQEMSLFDKFTAELEPPMNCGDQRIQVQTAIEIPTGIEPNIVNEVAWKADAQETHPQFISTMMEEEVASPMDEKQTDEPWATVGGEEGECSDWSVEEIEPEMVQKMAFPLGRMTSFDECEGKAITMECPSNTFVDISFDEEKQEPLAAGSDDSSDEDRREFTQVQQGRLVDRQLLEGEPVDPGEMNVTALDAAAYTWRSGLKFDSGLLDFTQAECSWIREIADHYDMERSHSTQEEVAYPEMPQNMTFPPGRMTSFDESREVQANSMECSGNTVLDTSLDEEKQEPLAVGSDDNSDEDRREITQVQQGRLVDRQLLEGEPVDPGEMNVTALDAAADTWRSGWKSDSGLLDNMQAEGSCIWETAYHYDMERSHAKQEEVAYPEMPQNMTFPPGRITSFDESHEVQANSMECSGNTVLDISLDEEEQEPIAAGRDENSDEDHRESTQVQQDRLVNRQLLDGEPVDPGETSVTALDAATYTWRNAMKLGTNLLDCLQAGGGWMWEKTDHDDMGPSHVMQEVVGSPENTQNMDFPHGRITLHDQGLEGQANSMERPDHTVLDMSFDEEEQKYEWPCWAGTNANTWETHEYENTEHESEPLQTYEYGGLETPWTTPMSWNVEDYERRPEYEASQVENQQDHIAISIDETFGEESSPWTTIPMGNQDEHEDYNSWP